MGLQLGVYQDRLAYNSALTGGTRMLADWTLDAFNVQITTDEYGFGALTCDVAMDGDEAILWRDRPGAPRVALSDGPTIVWEGRLEVKGATDDGLAVQALGNFRDYTDAAMRELWSTATPGDWREIVKEEKYNPGSGAVDRWDPDRWQFDKNEYLLIVPRTGEYYHSQGRAGLVLLVPNQSTLYPARVSFAYDVWLLGFWEARIYSASWDGTTFTNLNQEWIATSTVGAQLTGAATLTIATPRNAIIIDINAPSDPPGLQYTGQTGERYAKFTNMRVQQLNNATTLASDIVSALIQRNFVSFSASLAGVTPSTVDLKDAIFEDMTWLDAIASLRTQASETGIWAFEVWEGRRAYFRALVRVGMPTYYVDDAEIDHASDIDKLAVNVNAVWSNDRMLHGNQRNIGIIDAKARTRHALNRTAVYRASTTSSAQAGSEAQQQLVAGAAIIKTGQITFTECYDARGALVEAWRVRKGCRLVLRRNAILNYHEQAESIIVGRTSYNVDTGQLTAQALDLPDTLEAVLSGR